MRRIKLYIATSLDGFIARPGGGIDWLATEGDYGYARFYDSIDTVVMGRRTYETALSFGAYPYPDKAGFVFSRERAGTIDENVTFVAEDVEEFARNLRLRPGKDVWLIGGGELARAFFEKNLIDELQLFVHPILLGSGLPLFLPRQGDLPWRLLRSRPFPNGLVELHYERPGIS
ncbi:MAG: dihydrofolate reductase [Thermoanaerobaculia bacterium]|nr:MAG: dihydrofolate reductase [Thermoanaerobaculia bacterium]